MILFTSVTKRTFGKGSVIYLGLSLFLVLFTYIYEQFSYGERSFYMRGMFLISLIASIIFLLSGLVGTWIRHRVAYLFFNSAIAILISGCLIKGIIEISGRTTTIEQSYWIAGLGLVILSVLTGCLKKASE